MKRTSEFKQRFFKFDTLHAMYLVPLSLLGLYCTAFFPEWMIHVLAAIVFLFCFVEGLRRACSNPNKAEALKVLRRESYIANNFDVKHKPAR